MLASEIPILVKATRDFANRPEIRRDFARLQADPEDRAALEYIERALVSLTDTGPVSGRLHDARRRLLASVGPIHDAVIELPLQQPGKSALIWSGQSAHLRSVQPITSDGVTVGTIELVYGLPELTRMISGGDDSHPSGEMQLCSLHGQGMRCFPMRLAPHRSELLSATGTGPTIMARALAAERGVAFDTDYRGERVISAYGPVGDLGLGLVLKIDVTEIYAPLRDRSQLALLVIALIIGAGILLLRARLVPLVRRLALSEKRFRGVLESAPDAMLVTGLDGRIEWVNSQTERLFGYTLAELIGQSVEILVPETAREKHIMQRNRYAKPPTGRDVGTPLDLRGRRKDGSEFPAEIGLSPQETEDGVRIISPDRASHPKDALFG